MDVFKNVCYEDIITYYNKSIFFEIFNKITSTLNHHSHYISTLSSLSLQLNPKYNTNKDIYVVIDKELKPILLENVKIVFSCDTMVY
jgi:hypothetical protein